MTKQDQLLRRAAACDAAQLTQEIADALFTLLNAWSRRGSFATPAAARLDLIQQVTLALVGRVAGLSRNIGGRKQLAAFQAATVQSVYNNINAKGTNK